MSLTHSIFTCARAVASANAKTERVRDDCGRRGAQAVQAVHIISTANYTCVKSLSPHYCRPRLFIKYFLLDSCASFLMLSTLTSVKAIIHQLGIDVLMLVRVVCIRNEAQESGRNLKDNKILELDLSCWIFSCLVLKQKC